MRHSLRNKVLLLTALLATVPAAAVGWALIDINADTLGTAGRELQISALEDLSRTLDEELRSSERGLEKVADILVREEIPDESRIQTAIAIIESHDRLDHAIIYDKRGELIDAIVQEKTTIPEFPKKLSPELLATLGQEGRVVGETTKTTSGPRVLIANAIQAKDKVTGFAASLVSLTPLQQRLENLVDAHYQGNDDALFIVDERRRLIAHSNIEAVESMESMSHHPAFAGLDSRAIGPEVSLALEFLRQDDSEPMVGAIVGLKHRGWLAVAQQPRPIVYRSLTRMRKIVAMSIAAAIAIALALGILFSRRITAPLSHLVSLAKSIARRDFSARASVESKDELGLLAQTMNQAADDLATSEQKIKQEAEIRNDLGRYLPAELVSKIVTREQSMQLGGQRQSISVLFADVVSFTPLTEKLDPEQVVQILNEMFTISTEIIFRHGGTVDKFIGDCVMALWGAPEPQEDHAFRALQAAEELLSWLEVGNRGWKERYGVEVQISIGINSGEAIVGNIGSERRMEYTAIGDVVNVAARLESLARPMQVLLSSATKELVGDEYDYLSCGTKQVLGRQEAIEIFELQR